LCERFAAVSSKESLSWDGLRWTGLRSALAGLAAYLHEFKESVECPVPGDQFLADLLSSREAPPCYEFKTEKQYHAAKEVIETLLLCIAEFESKMVCQNEQKQAERPFRDGPRPRVEVGSRPPI
jgi:hypothetical protein